MALGFFCCGVLGGIDNISGLTGWLLGRNTQGIKAWEWSGHVIQKKVVTLPGYPSRTRIILIVKDVKPVVAIVSSGGNAPRYVSRIKVLDSSISNILGVPVTVFEGVQSPALNYLLQIGASLIVATLGLFVFWVAMVNFRNVDV